MKAILFYLLALIFFNLWFFSSCSKDQSSVEITAPKALLSVATDTGNTSTTFSFDATGSTGATQYRWDWENDGTWDLAYNASKTATHTFTTTGTYTVKLEVKAANNLTDTVTKTITVSLGPAPKAKSKYYLIANMANTSWYDMETGTPGFISTNTQLSSQWGPTGKDVIITIQFNVANQPHSITASHILALKGKTLLYDKTGESVSVSIVKDGVSLKTALVADQSSSTFLVSDVTPVDVMMDDIYLYTDYILKGTFSCKVDDVGQSGTINLTSGTFTLLLSGEYL